MNQQTELPLIGLARRPMQEADDADIARCKSISDCVDICLRKAGMNYKECAAEVGISKSYFSMLMNGQRPWQDDIVDCVMYATGCWLPRQWKDKRSGGQFWIDPVKSRIAQLEAEVEALRKQEAA